MEVLITVMPKANSVNDLACIKCHAITHDSKQCWNCKGTQMSRRFRHQVLIVNPETSVIANALKITIPGLFAVEVIE